MIFFSALFSIPRTVSARQELVCIRNDDIFYSFFVTLKQFHVVALNHVTIIAIGHGLIKTMNMCLGQLKISLQYLLGVKSRIYHQTWKLGGPLGGAVGGSVPVSNKKEKKARCLYDFEETTKHNFYLLINFQESPLLILKDKEICLLFLYPFRKLYCLFELF